MSKGGINDLGLAAEQIDGATAPISYDTDLPDYGSRQIPLQPGIYLFQLPANLSAIYDKITRQVPSGEGKREAERIEAIFDADDPLIILQSPDGERVGEAHQARVNNAERWRTKDHTIKASDFDYLLRAVGETLQPTPDPKVPGDNINAAYMRALARHGGGTFTAEIGLTYNCSAKRSIYARTEEGQTVEVEGIAGNGAFYRHGEGPAQRDPQTGLYPIEIEEMVQGQDPSTGEPVAYNAVIRGFNEFVRFLPPA